MRIPSKIKKGDLIKWSDDDLAPVCTAQVTFAEDDKEFIFAENDLAEYALNKNKDFEHFEVLVK